MCEDINECDYVGSCSAHSQCVNNVESYICQCDAGYHGDGFFGGCHDIDECADESDKCNNVSDCVNTALLNTHVTRIRKKC